MQRTLLLLLTAAALVGCGGSGSGSSSASSAAAPVSTAATTTQTQTAPVASAQSPTGSNGSGGQAGADLRTYDARDYHLLVPQSYDPQTPMPLLVLFHGSGDTAANFDRTIQAAGWHAAAEAEGVILVVPDTKSPFQSFPVWSGNPNNDLPQMRTELAGVTELLAQDVLTRFNVDLTSVHALGFSDGGLFNAAVGLSESSFASHSIWGYGWGGFYISQPAGLGPVRFRCGTADRFYPNAVQSEAFLAAQGHPSDLRELAGVGHTFTGLSTDPTAELRVLKGLALSAVPGGALSSPAPTTPTTPPGVTGSGGTGGQPGLQTRSVQTQAQAGLPSISIDYDVYVPSTYTPQTPLPVLFAANMGLNAILTEVEGAFNVDTKRRYYHGFSAGAHWGYVVVLSNANTFAGLGINAGSMNLAIQQGVWPGQVSRQIPIAIRHGITDAVVPVAAGQADRTRLMNANHPVAYEEFQGGHTVSVADAQAIWNALRTARAP